MYDFYIILYTYYILHILFLLSRAYPTKFLFGSVPLNIQRIGDWKSPTDAFVILFDFTPKKKTNPIFLKDLDLFVSLTGIKSIVAYPTSYTGYTFDVL